VKRNYFIYSSVVFMWNAFSYTSRNLLGADDPVIENLFLPGR